MTAITKSMSALVVITLVLGSFLTMVTVVSATNDPPNNQALNIWINDWNVTDARTYTGGTYVRMINGNVTVENGGKLTLDDSTIAFQNHGLIVKSGGTFVMKNNSLITGFNGQMYYCVFEPGSKITLANSIIRGTGGSVDNSPVTGIYFGSDNATSDHMLFQTLLWNNETVTVSGKNVVFRNSTIESYHFNVMLVTGSAFLYDCLIQLNGTYSRDGIVVSPGGQVTLVKNTIKGIWHYSVYLIGATGTFSKNTILGSSQAIFAEQGSSLDIRDNTLTGNGYSGIWLDHSKAYIARNTITMQTFGIYLNTHASADLEWNILKDCNVGLGVYLNDFLNLTKGNKIFNNSEGGIWANWGIVNSTGTQYYNNGWQYGSVYSSHSVISMNKDDVTGPGMLDLKDQSVVTMTDTKVDMAVTGGEIYCDKGAVLNITGGTVSGQDELIGDYGGSSVTVSHTTFLGLGTAIYSNTYSKFTGIDNTYTNLGGLANAFDGSTVVLKGGTYTGNTTYQNYISQAANGGVIELNGMTFNAPVGSVLADGFNGGSSYLYDCTVNFQSAQMLRASGGRVVSINSTPTTSNGQIRPDWGNGWIDYGWHADLRTRWQNDAVAPNASVELKDSMGVLMGDLMTDGQGAATADIIEKTLDDKGVHDHNNYTLEGDLNGMSGQTTAKVLGNDLGTKAIMIELQDTSAPFVNITYPGNDFLTNEKKFTAYGTVFDNGSGLAKVEGKLGNGPWFPILEKKQLHQVNGVDLSGDEMDYQVKATDVAGLYSIAKINLTIDWKAPGLVITQPASMYETSGTFYLNGTTEAGANVTVDGTYATVTGTNFSVKLTKADGTYNISVTAKDAAGNVNQTYKVLVVDTVAPTLSCDVANGTWTNKTTFVLTGKTDGDFVKVGTKAATVDLKNKTWSLGLTLAEGVNAVTMTALDLAGNSVSSQIFINLDTVAPVLNITDPKTLGPIYTNQANLTVKGNVTETNLESVTIELGTQVLPPITAVPFEQVLTLKEGDNKITVAATDKAGNRAAAVIDIVLDTKAPVVSLTSPKAGLVTKAASVQVTGTVNEPAATLMLGTTAMTNSGGTFSTTAALTVGSNTITITAKDLAGNVGTATVTVTYDNVATLVLTAPAKASVSTTKDSITVSGTSETGASIYINDVLIPANPDGTFSYKLVLKTGKTVVNVKAVDPAGNVQTSSFTATRTDPTQYDMASVLGAGLGLLIVGLIIGLIVGMVLGKSKPSSKPAPEEEPEEDEKEETEKDEDEEEEDEKDESDKDETEEDEEKEEEPEEDEEGTENEKK